MQAKYLPPVAAPFVASFTRALLLVAASCLASPAAFAQASGPASAANADMLSWMARGLLAAVVVVTVLTSIVLLVVFTTARRPDSRPLAPAPPVPAGSPEAVAA